MTFLKKTTNQQQQTYNQNVCLFYAIFRYKNSLKQHFNGMEGSVIQDILSLRTIATFLMFVCCKIYEPLGNERVKVLY